MRILLTFIIAIYSMAAISDSELIYEAQKKNIHLTKKDKKILEIGEISTTRYVIGGVLGTYPLGLGIGHAVQGRWEEDGAKFTWGQLGSLGVILIGAVGCNKDDEWDCSGGNEGLIVAGVIGYVGFRLWEIVDVWAAPPSYNSKYKKLQKYIEQSKSSDQIKASLDLIPIINPRMGQGVGLKYSF